MSHPCLPITGSLFWRVKVQIAPAAGLEVHVVVQAGLLTERLEQRRLTASPPLLRSVTVSDR